MEFLVHVLSLFEIYLCWVNRQGVVYKWDQGIDRIKSCAGVFSGARANSPSFGYAFHIRVLSIGPNQTLGSMKGDGVFVWDKWGFCRGVPSLRVCLYTEGCLVQVNIV